MVCRKGCDEVDSLIRKKNKLVRSNSYGDGGMRMSVPDQMGKGLSIGWQMKRLPTNTHIGDMI